MKPTFDSASAQDRAVVPAPRTPWASFPLLIALVGVTAIAVICGGLYWREAREAGKNVLDREARRTDIFSHFIGADLQSTLDDLKQLIDGDGLQADLITPADWALQHATHRAWFYSKLNPDYDQVRYINERGDEVIRVNHGGAIVPHDELQNKADRPYFQRANVLPAGQFFVSSFDLNEENGRIEEPLKPCLRLAAPVFDATGHRRGIYVINILAESYFTRLQLFTPQYKQRLRVLNDKGFWLKAAEPAQEWGFTVPGRSGETLAKTDPELWAQISQQPSGQIPYHGGYFTWHQVSPANLNTNRSDVVHAEEDYIIIASEISPEEWNFYFSSLRETFLTIAFVLLLLVLASVWFFRSRARAQLERDRFFSITRDMLCIAGFDGYFKRLNPAWEATLGYTSGELMAKPFLAFVHPDDREKTRLETESIVRGKDTTSFENRYLCKDGSYRWLAWSSRALLNEQLIFASARDLTDRKKIEEKILSLNNDLKHRADELEAANKELEAFTYSVSHDLRSPLRHIHGFVEMLQKAPAVQEDESSRRQMGIIAKAARQMGVLIDDLLAFSRTSRTEMHLVRIDMRELIDHAIDESVSETKERTVIWDIRPLPKVYGDANLIRLVWTNLVSNAIKYTRPRSEAKIEIGTTAGTAMNGAAGEYVFYIRDNGVGFDMRYASKLFGVFQRLHRADQFEGTGIGLANVQRIVHRHGGRVWAESQVGSGSVFYFSLPMNPVTEPTHAQNKTNPTGGR